MNDVRRGRGAPDNPPNRFAAEALEPWEIDLPVDDAGPIKTVFYKDRAKSILARNDSPDIPFRWDVNPYRGCEHGCIYCYARPYHEYLGLSAGVDFEQRFFVKSQAPALLRAELMATAWKPQRIGLSGVTDPYQPVERKLQLARGCLAVLAEFRNPVVVTKNRLVTRDIDLLRALADHQAAQVFLSITTLDDALAQVMEPRASRPALRLEAVRALADAGVPVGVMVAPIIPGLTDHEVPAILDAAAAAGAFTAGHNVVRLPHGVKDLFAEWLAAHVPHRKDKVLNRLRSMRDGKLNDAAFGARMAGAGPFADSIHQMFELHRRRAGLTRRLSLSTAAFRRPGQLDLFGP